MFQIGDWRWLSADFSKVIFRRHAHGRGSGSPSLFRRLRDPLALTVFADCCFVFEISFFDSLTVSVSFAFAKRVISLRSPVSGIP
jgi:hypothetical protein